MEITLVLDEVVVNFMFLAILFSIIAIVFGLIYLSLSFMIEWLVNLEGKIRTEKVWRAAIKMYMDKKKEEALNVEKLVLNGSESWTVFNSNLTKVDVTNCSEDKINEVK